MLQAAAGMFAAATGCCCSIADAAHGFVCHFRRSCLPRLPSPATYCCGRGDRGNLFQRTSKLGSFLRTLATVIYRCVPLRTSVRTATTYVPAPPPLPLHTQNCHYVLQETKEPVDDVLQKFDSHDRKKISAQTNSLKVPRCTYVRTHTVERNQSTCMYA